MERQIIEKQRHEILELKSQFHRFEDHVHKDLRYINELRETNDNLLIENLQLEQRLKESELHVEILRETIKDLEGELNGQSIGSDAHNSRGTFPEPAPANLLAG